MHSIDRRRFLCRSIGALGVAGFADRSLAATRPGPPPGLRPASRTSTALGARVTVTALHTSEGAARRAIDAAFAELDLIEDVMSLYRPGSQLCRLNREGHLDRPHPHLVAVLAAARRVSARTGGAFDVTVQPLWQLYARRNGEAGLPGPDEIARERRRVDYRRLEVGARRIALLGEGMAVTLNGIAQGFAADRTVAVLRDHGVAHALVDAGEVRPLGRKPDDEPWKVGVQHPREPDAYAALVRLDGRALSTSGDYATAFSPDRRHHHILDPRTGVSPATFSSVSVLAPTAMEADALSTALFVVGPVRGLELIAATPRVDALFILKDGHTLATSGFPADD